MFPNITDFRFYRERQPMPAWAQPFAQPAKRFSYNIDAVINEHAGIQPTRSEASAARLAGNVRHLNKKLLGMLDEIASGRQQLPIAHLQGSRCAAFARKWAERIRSEERRRSTLALTDEQLSRAIDDMMKW